MANASKPRQEKKGQKAKPDTNAKRSAESAPGKKGKGKAKAGIQEHVLALGGDKDDIALLKGVQADGELIQGEQETDVRTTFTSSIPLVFMFCVSLTIASTRQRCVQISARTKVRLGAQAETRREKTRTEAEGVEEKAEEAKDKGCRYS